MNPKKYKKQEQELPTYLDGIGEFMVESIFKSNDPYKYLNKHVELYQNEKNTIKEGVITKINAESLPNNKIKYTYDILFHNNELKKKVKLNNNYRIFEYKKTNYINVLNEFKTYISITKPNYQQMIDIGNEFVRV